MKKIKISWVALLCLFMTTTIVKAQDSVQYLNPTFNFTNQFDNSQLSNFNPSEVPYGVLIDRVYGWSGIANLAEKPTVSKDKMVQAWYDLYTSTYKFSGDLGYPEFKTHLVQYDLSKKMPLVIINYNFSKIDSTAFNSQPTDSNGYYISSGNKALPYTKNQANLIGLYNTDTYYEGIPIEVVFDKKLFLQNTNNQIARIIITNNINDTKLVFDKESEQLLTLDIAGDIVLQIFCELNNGMQFTCFQKIQITPFKKVRAACPGSERHEWIESAIPFQGYNEAFATTTFADFHVYHKYLNNDPTNCDTKITKPIFFLDGFYAMNERNFDEIYSDFITTDKDVKPGNIAEQLRLKGYDLIIVNFPEVGEVIKVPGQPPVAVSDMVHRQNGQLLQINRDGGADFVERNAMAFVALMQQINREVRYNAKAANKTPEQTVIIGPSMGGQVSRYALAYMEKQSAANPTNTAWNHNCRLWVSFDSPHEGANILISTQQALDHLGKFYGDQTALYKFNTQVRSNVARQFLINQLDGLNDGAAFHQNYYYGTTNNGFDALNTNGLPNSHGYPINCRKIALINGSSDGIETLSAGTEIGWIKASGSVNTRALDFHVRFMESTGGTNNTFEAYQLQKDGIFMGFSTVLSTTSAFTITPTNGMTLERKLKVDYWNYINNWQLVHDKVFKRWSTFTTTNNNNHGSLDCAPGGMINVNGVLLNPVLKELNTLLAAGTVKKIDASFIAPNSCFIPSISALGFKNSNFKWNQKFSDRNLLCGPNGNEIYFDNYFAPMVSEEHVHISDAAFAWIETELNKGHKGPDCIQTTCGLAIEGADMCLGGMQNFGINMPLPAGIKVTWLSSISAIQTVGGGSPNPTIKLLDITGNANNFSFTLTAIIENPCGANITLTKKIFVHAPYSLKDFSIVNKPTKCSNYYTLNYKYGAMPNDIEASWSTNGSATFTPYSNVVNQSGQMGGCINYPDLAMVALRDNCGLIGNTYMSVLGATNIGCSCKKGNAIADFSEFKLDVYPNPTTDTWNVILYNFIYTQYASCKLYDFNGRLVYEATKTDFRNSNITIPTAHLQKGFYMLKVISDANTQMIKLIKE
jgi:Secretion system C-terminal sorting domain